jgi:DNA-binding NtrC family response regulator
MKIWKALILEDDRVCRRLMEVYIQRLGGQAVSVSTVPDAKAALATEHFDICVTDLVLREGEANSLWCEDATGQNSKLPRLLVVTGVEPKAARKMLNGVNVAEVLHKPVQWRAFHVAVQFCLGNAVSVRHPALVPDIPARSAELQALMMKSLESELTQVRHCLAEGEHGQAGRLLHKLRGALRTAGWQPEAEQVLLAEQLLVDGKADAALDVLVRMHDGI